MNKAKCPRCGHLVQAEWYKEPDGTEYALCPNHGSEIVHCEIIEESEKVDGI